MIQFYITETGVYNPQSFVDPSQAFVFDIAHKRIKLMENDGYVLEFQKLTDTYASTIDSSDITGLSQKGANAMYNYILDRIDSSVLEIKQSIDRLDSSVNTLEEYVSIIDTSVNTLEEYVVDVSTRLDNVSTYARDVSVAVYNVS